MEITHILAILDPARDPGKTAGGAAARAAEIAERTGAKLTLAVFEDHQTIVESGVMADALTREAVEAWVEQTRKWLEEVAEGLPGKLKPSLKVESGHPLARHILATIDEGGHDLVVKDSRNEGFLSRTLFTPLDWHLLRRCPVPLMLAKAEGGTRPERIAAAVDPFHERGKPAELDRQILETAGFMAEFFGAELHAVHACQTQPLGAGSPLEGPSLHFEKVREEINRHHTQALQALADEVGLPRDRAHFIDAPARRAIPDFCRDQDIGLLVMGTVTRKGLTRLVMGSTAEAILNDLGCDVLAIKPEGFRQALDKQG